MHPSGLFEDHCTVRNTGVTEAPGRGGALVGWKGPLCPKPKMSLKHQQGHTSTRRLCFLARWAPTFSELNYGCWRLQHHGCSGKSSHLLVQLQHIYLGDFFFFFEINNRALCTFSKLSFWREGFLSPISSVNTAGLLTWLDVQQNRSWILSGCLSFFSERSVAVWQMSSRGASRRCITELVSMCLFSARRAHRCRVSLTP